MLTDQFDQPGMDGRPDRCPDSATRGRTRKLFFLNTQLRHIFDGDLDPQLELPGASRFDDADFSRHNLVVVPLDLGSSQETCHFVERPLGRREADSLHWRPIRILSLSQIFQSFQRSDQVCAPFASDQRVNFIHDHSIDACQDLT